VGGVLDHYVAQVVQAQDYYAFGAAMEGRSFSISAYRFGFQGMEKEGELYGDGNAYYTQYRMLDVRIGRWFSTDPVVQPWMSPYSAFDNNPIFLVDPLGLKSRDASGTVRNGDYKNFWDVLLHRSPKETLKVWGNAVKGLFGPASSDPPIRKWDIADKRKALSPARQAAVAKAHEFVAKRSHTEPQYKYGARSEPGGKMDCQGLVDVCIMAAGYPDPDNHKRASGVKNIVAASRKITLRDVLPGDAVTIQWPTSSDPLGHVGIIVDVQRGNHNEVTRLRIVHSAGNEGDPSSGPMYNQFDIIDFGLWTNAERKGKIYPFEWITGYYSWVRIEQSQTIIRPKASQPTAPSRGGDSPAIPVISDENNQGYLTRKLERFLRYVFY